MKIEVVTHFISAIMQENVEMILLFLSCKIDYVNSCIENKETLEKCKFDDIDYDDWCDSDVFGEHNNKSALVIAVLQRNVEIVRLLLENKNQNTFYKEIKMLGVGSSSDYFGKNEETPLNIAISNGNFEIVDLLVNHDKIDPNICSVKVKDWESFIKDQSESSDDVIVIDLNRHEQLRLREITISQILYKTVYR